MTARTPMGMTGNINATPRTAVDANTMQRARPGVFSGTPAYQPTPGTPYGYGSYQVLFPLMFNIYRDFYCVIYMRKRRKKICIYEKIPS